jgi:hypothetical protein
MTFDLCPSIFPLAPDSATSFPARSQPAFPAELICDIIVGMAFPIKTCVACGEEFELRPGKPGFANRCPECSEPEEVSTIGPSSLAPGDNRTDSGLNEARRSAMRDLLYRKES